METRRLTEYTLSDAPGVGRSTTRRRAPRAGWAVALGLTLSLYHLSQGALLGAQAGDLGSSVLTNRCVNLIETNRLVANADGTMNLPRALAVKAAFTVPILWGMHVLAQRGHPRIAALFGVLYAASPVYFTLHNLSLPCVTAGRV